MKKLLPLFVIGLSLCVWPIFLRIPNEISHVFGLIEIDLFSWYRFWLVILVGSTFLIFLRGEAPYTLIALWLPIAFSTIYSPFYRTAMFGSPWNHEGLIAITGYMGIYLAARKTGMFKAIEKAFDVVIIIMFAACALQILYGSFFEFPLIKWLLPKHQYQNEASWPLYGTLGVGNHLGLFCSLFLPYALVRKKYVMSGLLLFMVIGSQFRAAWVSVLVVSLLISKRTALYVAVALVILAVPFHKEVIPRLNRTFQEMKNPLKDSSLSGRVYIWSTAVPILRLANTYGFGPATFGLLIPQKTQRAKDLGFAAGSNTISVVVDRPHNMYLNIWLGSGLVSLLILMVGIGKILYFGSDRALRLGCIGFLITGLATDSVLSVTPYFLIFLGSLSYEYNEKRRHVERERAVSSYYRISGA